MFRTHTCGELNLNLVNQKVTLAGWIQVIRDKGFIIYIDLRDYYGITQLIFDENRTDKNLLKLVRTLGKEFVIQVTGIVIERENKNFKNPTGKIEILVSQITILNSSDILPFNIDDYTNANEELRMKFRYLDIRRHPLKNNLIFRSQINQQIRNFLYEEGFIEVETPTLIKSTPEGARDFIVPSRINIGAFYALPQSPQMFKQLLMIGGIDKYFQIVKCFRDEDSRSDRQPEFTQIDCEMSFIEKEDILNTFEKMINKLLFYTNQIIPKKIPRMTYQEAIETYGTDKPDIRFAMKIVELNDIFKKKNIPLFKSAELIAGINIQNCPNNIKKKIQEFESFLQISKKNNQKIIDIKFNTEQKIQSFLNKFYSQSDLKEIIKKFNANPKDLILILFGKSNEVRAQLSNLRIKIAQKLNLINPKKFEPLWIIDFPLFKFNKITNRYSPMHHPFTEPKIEDYKLFKENPLKIRSNSYDLIINGNEIGGGSIRIYQKEIQSKIFDFLGFTRKEANKQFGFLMNAFKYGAPPHGGIAFGLDRLITVLNGKETIRDFIAFPKNNSGKDLMVETPSKISKQQLQELNINFLI